MNRQQQIDEFPLKAHQLALSRLRANPVRLQDVQASPMSVLITQQERSALLREVRQLP